MKSFVVSTNKTVFQWRFWLLNIDGGVNLKVRGPTGKWGGCGLRNAKIWSKKGRFCKNLVKIQNLGGTAPSPAPPSMLKHISFGGHQTIGVQSFTCFVQMHNNLMFSEKGAWNYAEKDFKFLSIPSFLSVLYQIY